MFDTDLSAMLDDALARYSFSDEGELSDDEAGLLNAAGLPVGKLKRFGEDEK